MICNVIEQYALGLGADNSSLKSVTACENILMKIPNDPLIDGMNATANQWGCDLQISRCQSLTSLEGVALTLDFYRTLTTGGRKGRAVWLIVCLARGAKACLGTRVPSLIQSFVFLPFKCTRKNSSVFYKQMPSNLDMTPVTGFFSVFNFLIFFSNSFFNLQKSICIEVWNSSTNYQLKCNSHKVFKRILKLKLFQS